MITEVQQITWEQYNELIHGLQAKIFAQQVSDQIRFRSIAGIPRGGLIPAIHLSHFLDLPFRELDRRLELSEVPLLIVDDIVNTGRTLLDIERTVCTVAVSWGRHIPFRFVTIFRRETAPKNKLHWLWMETVPDDLWIQFPWELPPTGAELETSGVLRKGNANG